MPGRHRERSIVLHHLLENGEDMFHVLNEKQEELGVFHGPPPAAGAHLEVTGRDGTKQMVLVLDVRYEVDVTTRSARAVVTLQGA